MKQLVFPILTILFTLSSTALVAQSSHLEDDILLDKKFDGFKALDIQYEYLSPSDYRMKMDKENKQYEKGRINSIQRFNAAATMPIIAKKTFVFSLSGKYNYQAVDFGKVQTVNIGVPTPPHHYSEELHGYAVGASAVMNGKLFGKHMLYVASIVADGSHGFETVTGMMVATMVLKKNETTSMSVGLYGSTARSSIFPFFPIFAYTHRFASGWTFDSVLPQRAHMRKVIGRNGRFSGGFTLDSNTFYIYPSDRQNFPHNYTYNRIDARLDVEYEHFMTKHILFNAKAGFNKCYEGALRQKYKTKDIVIFKQDANFFMNVGVAYKL
ncbi:hypothetical protein [Dysgonomonas sp. 25]|uniref:hypothetical protein n=1 Tax=Dysgonomonas sp. 25 TaxID=2302933 RepID=UPI0013D67BEE|nr:hypothetical protein [Dysgonomonas sp. 25]NDV69203.1 hypothetical protein [Dysgonomonas sp. 25]